MADRARLSPPKAAQQDWPWHKPEYSTVSIATLAGGDRRMEAATYLDPGYAIRCGLTARSGGWRCLGDIARVWQPSRLKGIQVDRKNGTPFLSATQVFEQRPTPRKWLARERTPAAEQRLVSHGTILLTCSGNVGRVTIAHSGISNVFVSHDLLRIEPSDAAWRGWIYAYLLAPSVRAMLRATQYGHVVKHLETSHLNGVPVIDLTERQRSAFNLIFDEIIRVREEAFRLRDEAEALLANSLGVTIQDDELVPWFIRTVSDVSLGRRRLDASFHAPSAREVVAHFREKNLPTERLGTVCHRIWWETRFSRVFGSNGAPYMSSDELFSIDLPTSKRIMLDPIDRPDRFFVEAGWLLIACSGQTYGVNGSVALMTEQHERYFFSHDLVRIAPDGTKIASGYLSVYLGHRHIGYPLLIRYAYGSSIPHLDPNDVAAVPIARLGHGQERQIAELGELSAQLHERARELEDRIARGADRIVNAFIEVNDVKATDLQIDELLSASRVTAAS